MLRRHFHKAGPPAEGGRARDDDKKEDHQAGEFLEVRDCFMIYGGQAANASARHRKQERQEVCSVKVAAPVYLDWSDKPITFDQVDHPDLVPSPGKYPLVVDPVIGDVRLTKVLMDGGGSLNIIYAETLGLLRVDLSSDNSIFPSALGRPPTSEGRPSHSRWLGSEEPTTQYWGGHATRSSWPSPTTPTSSSRCRAPTGSSPSAPRTDTRSNATWSAWSTPRPSPNPRPSSPT
jgi:hypothetical protein